MKKLSVLTAVCASALAFPAHSAVMWSFNYTDAGVGFNDPSLGGARRNALESAASYISTFLTGYNASLQIDVNGSLTGSSLLASAGTNYNAPFPGPGFGDQGDIMRKVLGGNAADPNPGAADGVVNWNFTNFTWQLGNTFQPGEFDFFSTAVHELLHALGFSSGISQAGNDAYGTAPGSPGAWSPFDRYLTAFDGTPIIDSSFVLDSTLWNMASVSADGNGTPGCGAGLLFNGPNTLALNGGVAAQIYAPSTWEPGSSGSHLDDNCYTAPGNVSTYMMEAQTIDGLGVRSISPLEIGMFRDIGYTLFGQVAPVPVPEPGTLSLALFGAGLVGFFHRRRQSAPGETARDA